MATSEHVTQSYVEEQPATATVRQEGVEVEKGDGTEQAGEEVKKSTAEWEGKQISTNLRLTQEVKDPPSEGGMVVVVPQGF